MPLVSGLGGSIERRLPQPEGVPQGDPHACISAAVARALEIRTVSDGGPQRRLSHWFINWFAHQDPGLSLDEDPELPAVISAISDHGLALRDLDGASACEAPSAQAVADACGRRLSTELKSPFAPVARQRAAIEDALRGGAPLVLIFYLSAAYQEKASAEVGRVLGEGQYDITGPRHAVCAYDSCADGLLIVDSTDQNFAGAYHWILSWEVVLSRQLYLLVALRCSFSETP